MPVKSKQVCRTRGAGCAKMCAYDGDQQEIQSAFYRDQNFENQIVFGWDRKLRLFQDFSKGRLLENFWPEVQF